MKLVLFIPTLYAISCDTQNLEQCSSIYYSEESENDFFHTSEDLANFCQTSKISSTCCTQLTRAYTTDRELFQEYRYALSDSSGKYVSSGKLYGNIHHDGTQSQCERVSGPENYGNLSFIRMQILKTFLGHVK